jgi:TATA-box binding protein (TBP) (component of TFIID and TFIIIB)
MMVHITNVIVSANLECQFNLREIASRFNNTIYKPKAFQMVTWQHRRIVGKALLYASGKLFVTGVKHEPSARKSLTQYARYLQKNGYPVKISKIKLVTMSAVHKLTNEPDLSKIPGYELELANTAQIRKYGMTFLLHSTGTVMITGIKNFGWEIVETVVLMEDLEFLLNTLE